MKRFRVCCKGLRDNLWTEGKDWGIGLSQQVRLGFSNKSRLDDDDVPCVIGLEQTAILYGIKHCPYCGKKLELIEDLCKHELGDEEDG